MSKKGKGKGDGGNKDKGDGGGNKNKNNNKSGDNKKRNVVRATVNKQQAKRLGIKGTANKVPARIEKNKVIYNGRVTDAKKIAKKLGVKPFDPAVFVRSNKKVRSGGIGFRNLLVYVKPSPQQSTSPVNPSPAPPVPPVGPIDASESVSTLQNTPVGGDLLANTTAGPGAYLVVGYSVAGLEGVLDQPFQIPNVGTITIGAGGGWNFVPLKDFIGNVPIIDYTVYLWQTEDENEEPSGSDSTLSIIVNPLVSLDIKIPQTRVVYDKYIVAEVVTYYAGYKWSININDTYNLQSPTFVVYRLTHDGTSYSVDSGFPKFTKASTDSTLNWNNPASWNTY